MTPRDPRETGQGEARDTCDQSCRYTAPGHVSHGFSCTDRRLQAATKQLGDARALLARFEPMDKPPAPHGADCHCKWCDARAFLAASGAAKPPTMSDEVLGCDYCQEPAIDKRTDGGGRPVDVCDECCNAMDRSAKREEARETEECRGDYERDSRKMEFDR